MNEPPLSPKNWPGILIVWVFVALTIFAWTHPGLFL